MTQGQIQTELLAAPDECVRGYMSGFGSFLVQSKNRNRELLLIVSPQVRREIENAAMP